MAWLAEHWDFVVGTALGILGIATGIAIAFWQRQPKTLDYYVRNVLPLHSPHAKAASRGLSAPLVMRHGDEYVEDPYLLTVRIINSGKRAIVDDDYVEPITIKCSGKEPFDGFVSSSNPPGVDP